MENPEIPPDCDTCTWRHVWPRVITLPFRCVMLTGIKYSSYDAKVHDRYLPRCAHDLWIRIILSILLIHLIIIVINTKLDLDWGKLIRLPELCSTVPGTPGGCRGRCPASWSCPAAGCSTRTGTASTGPAAARGVTRDTWHVTRDTGGTWAVAAVAAARRRGSSGPTMVRVLLLGEVWATTDCRHRTGCPPRPARLHHPNTWPSSCLHLATCRSGLSNYLLYAEMVM